MLGGANVTVTDDNKREYVQAMLDHKLGLSISVAVEGFRAGLHDVLGKYVRGKWRAEVQGVHRNPLGLFLTIFWRPTTSIPSAFPSS